MMSQSPFDEPKQPSHVGAMSAVQVAATAAELVVEASNVPMDDVRSSRTLLSVFAPAPPVLPARMSQLHLRQTSLRARKTYGVLQVLGLDLCSVAGQWVPRPCPCRLVLSFDRRCCPLKRSRVRSAPVVLMRRMYCGESALLQ